MIPQELAEAVGTALSPLQRYHDYEVAGLEHIPLQGPALLVIHHSLATYDALLLAYRIYEVTGRAMTGLGHDRLFGVPGLRRVVRKLGIHPASPQAGRSLLEAGELLGVAPGGMWEALRPSSERYQVRWSRRRGFVRLALEMQVPMVLAACPRADDLFDVRPHALTDWVYDRLRLPLPLVRGRAGWPVPRKVRLKHYVAPPIVPPPTTGPSEREIDDLHERATEVMRALLQRRD